MTLELPALRVCRRYSTSLRGCLENSLVRPLPNSVLFRAGDWHFSNHLNPSC